MNLNYLQKAALKKVANDNKLTEKQVEEIFSKVCEKAKITMSGYKQDENGISDMDSFKTIHIQGWGKFVPLYRMIKLLNNRKNERRNK